MFPMIQREQNYDSDNIPEMSWKHSSHILDVVQAALLLVELPQGAVPVKLPAKVHAASVNREFGADRFNSNLTSIITSPHYCVVDLHQRRSCIQAVQVGGGDAAGCRAQQTVSVKQH